ncbi:hypothetical protein SAMN04488581_4384 [Mycolicibacterium neoaurum]|uniref:SMODS domain-containing nucleotidyltransferase n=1 Tax=Mycolicibacterium neoaurum TaxID=1795 RepID=UPI0008850555|nr:hypothetical protein [Mycolicibacterium neoaurum]SDE62552.1 hypothetical protein SAMN04488581_4384 [Mycolicibacterium neoaurum]
MSMESAFDSFQQSVNADPEQVRLARARRDTFKQAFASEGDVTEVFGSGSLARSTQLAPVHDVDLVVVYKAAEHDDWGRAGQSAEDALRHVQSKVTSLLGANGTVSQLVRETRVAGRNRSVKCFIDPPDDDAAFTVDVMPVLRTEAGILLVPGARDKRWDEANPEYLIEAVAAKQQEWPHFRGVVRMLKSWRLDQKPAIKSLVMEVLALKCLQVGQNRPTALRDFFAAAAVEVFYGVEDPAGYCGPIQTDLDVEAVSSCLSVAHDYARYACTAAESGDANTAKYWWRQVFGTDFPGPAEASPAPPIAPPIDTPRPVRDAPQG